MHLTNNYWNYYYIYSDWECTLLYHPPVYCLRFVYFSHVIVSKYRFSFKVNHNFGFVQFGMSLNTKHRQVNAECGTSFWFLQHKIFMIIWNSINFMHKTFSFKRFCGQFPFPFRSSFFILDLLSFTIRIGLSCPLSFEIDFLIFFVGWLASKWMIFNLLNVCHSDFDKDFRAYCFE